MRGTAMLAMVLGAGCSPTFSSRLCNDDYWARRPAWGDKFYSSVHVSTNEPCSTVDDCKTTLHFCVEGRCRAFCSDDFRCPTNERCVTSLNGKAYEIPYQLCSNFTAPDDPNMLIERGSSGGVCVPKPKV